MSAMATSLAALESAERARAAEEVCLCVIDYNCTGDAYCIVGCCSVLHCIRD